MRAHARVLKSVSSQVRNVSELKTLYGEKNGKIISLLCDDRNFIKLIHCLKTVMTLYSFFCIYDVASWVNISRLKFFVFGFFTQLCAGWEIVFIIYIKWWFFQELLYESCANKNKSENKQTKSKKCKRVWLCECVFEILGRKKKPHNVSQRSMLILSHTQVFTSLDVYTVN